MVPVTVIAKYLSEMNCKFILEIVVLFGFFSLICSEVFLHVDVTDCNENEFYNTANRRCESCLIQDSIPMSNR